MVEALTPQVLTIALMAVLFVAPALALLISALILGLYRRAVLRAMAASAGHEAVALPAGAPNEVAARHPEAAPEATADAAADLDHRLLHEPWHAAARCVVAGVAFALAMALAVGLAFPALRSASGFAVPLWLCVWPIVMALALTAPGALRTSGVAVAAYAVLWAAASLPALLRQDAETLQFGGEAAAWAASFTPTHMLRLWLVQDGIPSALLLLFLSRWIRAVGPLVLGFVTTLVSGVVAAALLIFSKAGTQWVVNLVVSSGIPLQALLLGAAALTLATCALAGWAWLRWIRRGYLRKRLNDRSLTLDALWLLFASSYAMWMALVGLVWVAAPALAFAVYKLVAIVRPAPAPNRVRRGLTFLRVFSLGRRSERLFEALSRHWRHAGSMNLITGPDVAHSTVQPHQLLDFLAGRLATHFIHDAPSLELRLAQLDRAPDRDGRYRVNNLFCRADTWQTALARLVAAGDTVLMDLRSFGPSHAGCVFELRTLVNVVPLARCVLVVDASTDQVFLQRTLHEAWQELRPDSPNRAASPQDVPLHPLGDGHVGLRQLLKRLAAAARPP